MMKVSVIIPTYNRARLVCHSIDSILAQSFDDYEIIVIDDGSTDTTGQVLERYAGRINCIRQENRGFGAARNRGLEEAKGEYIAFLDSDDLWNEGKLALQVEIMDRLPEAAFVFSDFTILKPSGSLVNEGLRTWHAHRRPWDEIYGKKTASSALGLCSRAERDFDIYTGNIYRPLLDEPYVLPSSSMVRRSMLRPEIVFTAGDPLYADWDFFARLARDNDACFLDIATAVNRSHDDAVRLTTNCSALKTAEYRLSLIERVWKKDAEFMEKNRDSVKRVEAEQLSIIATQLLFENRAAEARAALKMAAALGARPAGARKLIKLFAYSPGGPRALTAARGLRRRLRGRTVNAAHGMSAAFTTEVITGPDGMRAISPEWNSLASRCGNPLMSHEWFLSCSEAFQEATPLRVLLVRRGGKAAAIAPLALTGKYGRRLEVLGAPFLFEPSALLLDGGEDTPAALMRAIASTGYPAVLRRLPRSTAFGSPKWTPDPGCICLCSPAPPSPFASMDAGWDGFLKGLSPQRRYDLRRARKRAEAHGAVSVDISCPAPLGLDRALDRVFLTEAAGWKGRNKSALLHNKRLGRFFRIYSERACRAGMLRVCTLEIGGRTAAVQLAIEYGGSFWALKTGYDEKWSHCSPGVQLTLECMKYACKKGLRSYEFLGAVEPWLKPLGAGRREHMSCFIYPRSFQGLLALGSDAPRLLAKRVLGKYLDADGPAPQNVRS